MVGLSIMGAASPVMLDMSLAPIIAQKRAQNLGIAESAAVTFAAQNEGATQIAAAPNGCTLDRANAPAYAITCTEGSNQFVQTVSRSFRLNPQNTGGSSTTSPTPITPTRTFPYPQISGPFGAHQCTAPDEWGISWGINWPTLQPCIPQVAWDKATYLASNPDDWLFDINNIRGFGIHPHY